MEADIVVEIGPRKNIDTSSQSNMRNTKKSTMNETKQQCLVVDTLLAKKLASEKNPQRSKYSVQKTLSTLRGGLSPSADGSRNDMHDIVYVKQPNRRKSAKPEQVASSSQSFEEQAVNKTIWEIVGCSLLCEECSAKGLQSCTHNNLNTVGTTEKSDNSKSHCSADILTNLSRNKRGKYKSYTYAERKAVVELSEIYGLRPVAKKLQIAASNISTWKVQLKTVGKKYGLKVGCGRSLTYGQDVERNIVSWVHSQWDLKRNVSRKSLCDYAKTVVNDDKFKASGGWVDKFLKRNKLSLQAKKKGQDGSSTDSECE